MIELPDDQTDKLFQEGAELFDFTYNPEAWKGMEELLDAEEKRRRKWPFILTFLVLLFLAGALISVFSTENTSSEQPIVAIDNSQTTSLDINPVNAEKDLINNESEEIGTSVTTVLDTEAPAASLDLEVAEVGSPSRSNKVSRNIATTISDLNTVSGKQDYDLPVHQKRAGDVLSIKKGSAVQGVGQQPKLSAQSTGEETVRRKETASTGDLVKTKLSNYLVKTEEILSDRDAEVDNVKVPLSALPLVAIQKIERADLLDGAALLSLGEIDFSEEEDIVATSVLSRLSVRAHGGLVYGVTDENGVGMPRSRYGLGLGYAVNDRLVLGSGVTINNLCYITDGENYRTKSTGWFGGASPSRIQALCKVLELPLEMTYHWKGRRESGLYFRGGILSYIMLSEDYDFSYENSEIPPGVDVFSLRRGWQEQNTNQHYLGMAQLSLGYQFALSRKTQLQVEGYIHAPLSGVGHGDVKVWSFGINSSLNLNFK